MQYFVATSARLFMRAIVRTSSALGSPGSDPLIWSDTGHNLNLLQASVAAAWPAGPSAHAATRSVTERPDPRNLFITTSISHLALGFPAYGHLPPIQPPTR